MTMEEVKGNLKQLEWLKVMPTDERIPIRFRCNGNRYKASVIFQDMEAGQFMNFSHLCKNVKPEDYIYQMHELIACMCTRKEYGFFFENGAVKLWRYKYDGYKENAEVFFNHLMMDKAYPFYVFFCKVMENLLPATQSYLMKEVKKMTNVLKVKQLFKRKNKKPSTNTGATTE